MIRLQQLTKIQAPSERCFHLARSVEVHLAGNVHWGAPARAVAGVTTGLTGLGDEVTWRARHFLIWQNLTTRISAFDPPKYFQATMQQGAFHFMQHDHFFRPLPAGSTEMNDVFRFEAPIPILGRIAEWLFLRRYMQSLLRERALVIKQAAESSDWQHYLPTFTPQTQPESSER